MEDARDPGSVYVMPWNGFQPSFSSGSVLQFVTLGIPRSVWIQGPVFGWNEWQRMPFSKWGPQVNKHFAKYTDNDNHRGGRTGQAGDKNDRDRDRDRSDKDSKRDDAGAADKDDKKPSAPKDGSAGKGETPSKDAAPPKEGSKPAPNTPNAGKSPPAKGGSAPAPKENKGPRG
jgi:hypothetical protein